MTAELFLIFSLFSGVVIAFVAKSIGREILLEKFRWMSWVFAVEGFSLGIRIATFITRMFVN